MFFLVLQSDAGPGTRSVAGQCAGGLSGQDLFLPDPDHLSFTDPMTLMLITSIIYLLMKSLILLGVVLVLEIIGFLVDPFWMTNPVNIPV